MKNFLNTFSSLLFSFSLINFLLIIFDQGLPISKIANIISFFITGLIVYTNNKAVCNTLLSELKASMMLEMKKRYQLLLQILFCGALLYLLGREVVFSLFLTSPLILKIFAYPNIPNAILWLSGSLLVLFGKDKNAKNSKRKKKISNAVYYFIFFIIVTLGSLLRIYKLNAFDIRGDEFQVVAAAAGHLYTGDYYLWNWIEDRPFCLEKTDKCYYDRAWPHTWMIAQSFKAFGISEVSSRIPSVIFGILFIVISYPIAFYFFKNKKVALAITALVALNPAYIDLSRYARMYAILLPIFLLAIYFLYRGFNEKSNFLTNNLVSKKFKPLIKYISYHYGFLILSVLLFIFSFVIHINTLIIGPAFLFYVFIIYFTKKESINNKALLPLIIGCFIIAVIIMKSYVGSFTYPNLFSWFARHNTAYLTHILAYPLNAASWLALICMNIIVLLRLRIFKLITNQHLLDVQLFLLILIGTTLLFFIFIADRYSAYVYTSHVTVFAIMLLLNGFYFVKNFLPKFTVYFLYLSFTIMILFHLTERGLARYDQQGAAVISTAYKTIVDRYDPDTQVLFLQYARDYYLKDLQEAVIISLLNNNQYSLEQFLIDSSKYESGYIAWETAKSGHLRVELRQFIEDNFQKLHGSGVDLTRVEVFYYNRGMLPNSNK